MPGVPVGVLVAPIIPVLTEHEIEAVLEAAREAGASLAGYTMLRLPWEVKDLFREWLAEHFPERAAHVMSHGARPCAASATTTPTSGPACMPPDPWRS